MGRILIYATIILTGCLTVLQAQTKFTVVIDPGHGGRDPGCVGTFAKEKTINLSVALKVGALIKQNFKDTKIIYTRKTDVFVPLDERANIANRNRADLFISIHTNSVKRGKANGTETYTLGLSHSIEHLDVAMRENAVIMLEEDYLQKYEGFDPNSTESYIIFEFIQNKHVEQSVSLASEIQKAFVRAKRPNRGVRQAGLLVLRKTGMPSVLVELGFISDRAEERYMVSQKGQNTLAHSIYRAFAGYRNSYDHRLGEAGNLLTGNRRPLPPSFDEIPDFIDEDDGEDDDMNYKPSKPAGGKDKNKNREKEQPAGIIYKIQLLTSDRKLPPNDKKFKGYDNISFYVEKNIYKYTCGATPDYRQIQALLKKVSKDFKGAFIIKTVEGNRIYK